MKRVGILGGTFDPPHLGHLIIAEEVYQALNLDEVWFIPSNQPPHKAAANVDNQKRWQMVKAAVASNRHFFVSDIELKRSGKSYTYDTMKQLKQDHDKTEFYFIIGGDMVEYLPKWQAIEQLVELVQFVGVKRSGYQLSSPYHIFEVEIPVIDISSSMIRERVKRGVGVRYLVPDAVMDYIKEHRLYEAGS